MAYCCVPGCTSLSRKGSGISFHEIPANPEYRKKWLHVISRKDWEPNDTSNYSRVCSKHFLTTDYKSNVKKRILLPTSIPSIFPTYPCYMQPPSKKQRTSQSVRKINECRNGSVVLQNTTVELDAIHFATEASVLTTHQDKSVQADIQVKERACELQSYKKKLKRTLKKMQDLQNSVDEYRRQLLDKEQDKDLCAFKKVLEATEQNSPLAIILVDQVRNFSRRFRPIWSECMIRNCILWQTCSPKGYRYARKNNLVKLPSSSTLKRFVGNVTDKNEVGVSPLVVQRLKTETNTLTCPREKLCSLILDEMSMQERYTYKKTQDEFVGCVDMGPAVSTFDNSTSQHITNPDSVQITETIDCTITPSANNCDTEVVKLAKCLLCFVICGLSKSYKIPVAYFFTRQLKAEQLFKIVKYVIKEVESCGFIIQRLVTDNLKVNTKLFKLLGNGLLIPKIIHPCDPKRELFLSFDYCHVIKNARNHFLQHRFGVFVKELYDIQSKSSDLVKPVRFLTRKHVYPNNFEKMNVLRAVQLFSPAVTAALKFLQAKEFRWGTSLFKDAGPAIECMEMLYKWFTVHDASNTVKHIHLRNPDCRHFDSVHDERLSWLKKGFQEYIYPLQVPTDGSRRLFSKETYEAIILTSDSSSMCIETLLTDSKFEYVLTRKFSSDPVEALFGCLRQSSGCHDQLDAVAVQNALKKVLVTGIIAATPNSSVRMSIKENQGPELSKLATPGQLQVSSFNKSASIASVPINKSTTTACAPIDKAGTTPSLSSFSSSSSIDVPSSVKCVLGMLAVTQKNHVMPTTVLNASIALVAGYIVRIVEEWMKCTYCSELVQRPKSQKPLLGVIRCQDRGGLMYPTDSLVSVLCTLQRFTQLVLPYLPPKTRVLSVIQSYVIPEMMKCPALLCDNPTKDVGHTEKLCSLISEKFLRPILSNHGSMITDSCAREKKISQKPLNRKVHKL